MYIRNEYVYIIYINISINNNNNNGNNKNNDGIISLARLRRAGANYYYFSLPPHRWITLPLSFGFFESVGGSTSLVWKRNERKKKYNPNETSIFGSPPYREHRQL